ncbi:unnamed protein product [Urochloa decumbens]|uniref:Uncharacterized protein n=1 Tax=Urochloa decumbens TaxID=240449 RepID=A0ABC9B6P7_9POAL
MGHLFAMVELGRALAERGLTITIIILDPPYDTGAPAPFLAGVSTANPSISFRCLLPPPAADDLPPVASKYYEALIIAAVRASIPSLRHLLAVSSMPTPDALVVDMFSGAALDVAGELGVPGYFFFTSGATCFAFFLHLQALHAQTAASFRDMGDELVHVPGVPPFPATHAVHATMDRNDAAYDGSMDAAASLRRCYGVIVNTFRSLESRAVDAITAGRCGTPPAPPVHCVGPLIKSLESSEGGGECLAWLDEQPEASVVFLCVGSLGRFSADQMRELAVGLEASGQRFLWLVRAPPPSGDDLSAEKRFQKKPPESDLDLLLPDGFQAQTRGRGLVVKSWTLQRDVLAHESPAAPPLPGGGAHPPSIPAVPSAGCSAAARRSLEEQLFLQRRRRRPELELQDEEGDGRASSSPPSPGSAAGRPSRRTGPARRRGRGALAKLDPAAPPLLLHAGRSCSYTQRRSCLMPLPSPGSAPPRSGQAPRSPRPGAPDPAAAVAAPSVSAGGEEALGERRRGGGAAALGAGGAAGLGEGLGARAEERRRARAVETREGGREEGAGRFWMDRERWGRRRKKEKGGKKRKSEERVDVLEAVIAGVPMLALPLHAEQRMNLVVLEEELRLAVGLEGYDRENGVVAAVEVRAKVRWLMDSDGGKELRERTAMAIVKAKEAVRQGGESDAALAWLVESWMTRSS